MSLPEPKKSPLAAPAGRGEAAPPLQRPVTSLWGVGAERAAQLARLDIHTVEDLLLHRPRRYEDRRHFRAIAELTRDEAATARGTIVAQGLKRFRGGTKTVFEFVLDDGTARLHCRWWNLPFMEKYFAVGDEVFVFGKLVETKPRTMDHPETEVIEAGEESFIHINRMAPIYPLTEGLPQRWLRGLIWRTLEKFESQFVEPQVGRVTPCAPPSGTIRRRAQDRAPYPDLPTRANAVRMIHFPEELTDAEMARRRLAFDEFVTLQCEIQLRRRNFEAKSRALPCGGDNRLMRPFLARLGFKLTNAQTNVLREIRSDMGGAHPMRRLLQGDVGSGKTVVAACTALMALESGFNVALMAPTEILAEQHFQNFSRWFEPLGIKVQLQTGSRKTASDEWHVTSDAKSRARLPVTLFIGTHALFTAGFDLPKLGLVVIDEQHKFGVTQREQLVSKGNYPHLLVMTATPIPRTLGLTLYGDLDVSVIDEMPAGRGRVKTFVRVADTLPKVWEFIREKLTAGRQAYVVYPRVEEQDTANDLKAVTREFENVRRSLAPFHVGLLHGRLKGREKEDVMTAFRANQIQALVATALIEVGLDVPNATVMLVENAERFGLAQLHQLRGRIGRGASESFCVLISGAKTGEARERLQVLEETADGFRIAETDLKLRGPGELLGQRQSGLPKFRFGNLTEDFDLIRRARELVAQPPGSFPKKI
ncbi:MAG TPA: ATP-dependent DNA helicase RecG [Candidatus Limnocylindrales bacterium]|nr:ATP-dependent DNA helicase RecG [Candidatus Limnocylindrales bacterium]